MAPRGSGHTTSDGSGSSGDASGSGGDSSRWLTSSGLIGYGFSNGYVVANIVFTGIWMLALCVIAIWAMGVDRRGEISHSVLGWKKYGIAITLMLIFYAFTFAQSIIQANGGFITNVYFLLADIFEDFLYPATTWLLLTIYSLLFHCCIFPDQTKRARHRAYFKVHIIICVVTIGLWIAILVLNIVDTSIAVDEIAFNPNDYFITRAKLIGFDLDGAFQAILLAAAVEILAFAIWLPARARRYGKEYYTASLYFLTLVAIPFLILRIFYLAYAAAFELTLELAESWGAYIAYNIFTGACTVIVFVGLVLVTRRLEQSQVRQFNGNQIAYQPQVAYWPTSTVPPNPQYDYGPINPIQAPQPYSQELHGQGQGLQEMSTHHIHHEKP